MYTKQFMTTSEFARICGVSKHTLFHYDDIGILQPEYVNEKGYRYYSVKQFFIFDIIATLQQAKTPLCEIKAYLEHKTPAGFLAILAEKSAELRREEKKIRRMQQLLAATTKMTRSALTAVCQTPSIEQMPAEYLMTVPLSSQGIEKEDVQKIGQHFHYCAAHHIEYEYPVGVIITREHLEQEIYDKPDYFFNKLRKNCSDAHVQIKPAGTYAIWHHKGSYGALPQSYAALCQYIKQQHFVISGNSYEQEILSYLSVENPEEYIITIAIEVSPRSSTPRDK